MDNKINEQILEELIMIRKLLTILSQDKLADFNEQIKIGTLQQNNERKCMIYLTGQRV